MIEKRDIICISSIDWDFVWQGHQEIMSKLAKNGNRVLFIENTGARMPNIRDISRVKKRISNWFHGAKGIKKVSDNLFILSPIVLPFPYLRIALWINRYAILSVLEKWFKSMGFANPIVWIFLPTPLSLEVIGHFNPRIVIYYCIDNFRASSVYAKKIKKSEIKLLKKTDLVFVTSKELYNYCRGYNANVYLFPFAVNFEKFENARLAKAARPHELDKIPQPIIAYVGGVHKWIDIGLIEKTAVRYPRYSFVFIGPLQTDVSRLLPYQNVYFLGKKEHDQIPDFISNSSVCLIPYLLTEYTKNVYPTKLNEYLAMGKPVISTALAEVIDFNTKNGGLILVAKTCDEFMDYIPKAINDSGHDSAYKRIAVAKKNDWNTKIEEMSNIIEDAIKVKSCAALDWKENFLKLYKLARRKAFKLGFILLIIYMSVFNTPLIWFLAVPLKIAQPPIKADCIVVLAGGVGESGKAGQGYEERVQYAVELFKKGYADSIIFSSGYKFIFEEAMIMKSLAIALGIPENAIIIEDKAVNTYQNVKFVKDILYENKWGSVLLISSPYHMRRVSMIFSRIAPEIMVIYTPIPTSEFYGVDIRKKEIIFWRPTTIQQIKGILHEYLGIIYYYIKRQV